MHAKSILRIAAVAAVIFNAALGAQVIPIADARAEPLGTVVTVEGAITVPSGRFAASTFDQGFAVEDDTAGIYVSIAENQGLNYNRHVRVTGTLDDDGFGLLVLRPADASDVETIPGATLIEAQPVATGDVSEATEGSLVEVSGTVTRGPTDDLPFGYSVFVDDGSGETQIFIPATTGVNPFTIPWVEVGQAIRVTGFGAQFLSQYEVLPRKRGDLHRAH
jgi:hypothetical protein